MPRHPHYFTLSLIRTIINEIPGVFPEAQRGEMIKVYESLLNNLQATKEEIEDKMVEFGKIIWPHRKAFEEMFERYGRHREEALVQEKLPPALRDRFLEFSRQGGKLNDAWRGTVSEDIFKPEERFALGEAMLNVRNIVKREVVTLCQGEKQAEFKELLDEYQTKKNKLIEKINLLKGLAETSPKWAPEIQDKVRAFEESFAFAEKSYTAEDMDGAIDYYRGVIEETESV